VAAWSLPAKVVWGSLIAAPWIVLMLLQGAPAWVVWLLWWLLLWIPLCTWCVTEFRRKRAAAEQWRHQEHSQGCGRPPTIS